MHICNILVYIERPPCSCCSPTSLAHPYSSNELSSFGVEKNDVLLLSHWCKKLVLVCVKKKHKIKIYLLCVQQKHISVATISMNINRTHTDISCASPSPITEPGGVHAV